MTVSNDDINNLVIARLNTFSKDRKISIGSDGEFTSSELIQRVKNQDEVGKKIVQIQLQYLQSLKDGFRFVPVIRSIPPI